MSLNYNVVISTTSPLLIDKGTLWIEPTLGELKIMIGDWDSIIISGEITSYVEDTYNMNLLVQTAEPTLVVGQLWLNDSTKTLYIGMSDWIPLVGG